MDSAPAERVDSNDLTEQVAKVLGSRTFAKKGQLRKLLEILYRKMGFQTSLKTDQIIQELWPAEIRTKSAADVATEMNRLRHALKSYYESEGANDPIVISLPNRAVTAGNGTHERPWIVAERPAEKHVAEGEHPSGRRVAEENTRKIVVFIAALVAILCVTTYFSIRALAFPDQPQFGRLDGTVLRVMGPGGKELWNRKFPQGFGPDTYYNDKEFGPRLWFADLEGKGHTSVLFSYLPAADAQPHSTTLICYSDRGREKWRWTPGRTLPEVQEPSTYRTSSVGVLKAMGKRPPRIVVVSSHDPWWGGPSQIAIVDSNGKTLSEYWHSGGLRDMVLADLDGDGGDEIIATGVAHGYDHQATLVVLDPENVSGASKEVQPEYQIHSIGIARERLRLLFPRSDLNRAAFQFNYAVEPAVQHGNLDVGVMECTAPKGCRIQYEFDRNLHLIAAYSSNDEFKSAHDRFYQNGNDAHRLGAEEQNAFLNVRCLAGCRTGLIPLAEVHNLAASFEKGWKGRTNPNGVWSYGYSSGFGKPITLYDKAVQNGINGVNAQYWLSSTTDTGTSPAAEYNNGPALNDGNVVLLENEFVLVAGIRGQYSDLVFTAPARGAYSIRGAFRGAQYGVGTVVGIAANGKILLSSRITSVGQLAPFDFALTLDAGNTVVFSVGPGSGTQNTGLSATVTLPCSSTDKTAATLTGELMCSGLPGLAGSSKAGPNRRSLSVQKN